MDIFHLLLGRLWQYEVGAMHDGRENTYRFREIRITSFIPVTEFGQEKGHAFVWPIMSLCTWWSGECYALVIKEMSKTAETAKSAKMAEEASR